MIDPGSIRAIVPYKENEIKIKFEAIPSYDFEPYDLYDEADFKKYINDVEKEVRSSFEYRRFIKYLRENMEMNKCSFLLDVEIDGNFNVKIEQHHYPFTLYDIALIVFNKRMYYHDSLELEMVAKEVMMLHYNLIIGLIPLSETVHELVHNEMIFIPVDKVLGRYSKFVDMYKEFMLPEHLDVLGRIEDYSKVYNEKNNINILTQTNITLETSGSYKLPELDVITKGMIGQINLIKNNGYILPCVSDDDYKEKLRLCKDNGLKEVLYFF